ncbi:hypothetical protein BpHYR1_050379 [Brachionus plicatilis]|uniref:Uncharacterized protein n=1 Tax=Brachionus plicatilis TaxID=10195 RepID=A0A3M7STK0_BRAPC|nr:hypothetical protein BpHYR1_050379 [Brachionus plicatilis]
MFLALMGFVFGSISSTGSIEKFTLISICSAKLSVFFEEESYLDKSGQLMSKYYEIKFKEKIRLQYLAFIHNNLIIPQNSNAHLDIIRISQEQLTDVSIILKIRKFNTLFIISSQQWNNKRSIIDFKRGILNNA